MSQVLLVSPGLSWFIGVGHLPVLGHPAAGLLVSHSWRSSSLRRAAWSECSVSSPHTEIFSFSWDQCSIDATVKNSQEWRSCNTIGLINVYPWDGERLIFVASERSQSCQDKRLMWEDNQDYIGKGNVVLRCMDMIGSHLFLSAYAQVVRCPFRTLQKGACYSQGTVGTTLISSCAWLVLKDWPVARTLGNLLSFSSHYGHIKYFLAADLK